VSTEIQWTDETWNPTVGCSRVSPGCDNCYAIRVAAREMQPAHVGLTRSAGADEHRGEPRDREARVGDATAGEQTLSPRRTLDWTGEVRLLPDRLDTPLHWRKPRRVFVDSMSDLFHPEVLKADDGNPTPFLARVFAVMVQAEQHTFQVLTKRPQVMRAVLSEPMFRLDVNTELLRRGHAVMPGGMTDPSFRWPSNIWLGTSVENQRYADLRVPHLLATPAAVRFLSIEPLLGPVDLYGWLPDPENDKFGPVTPRVDWVIGGGESGPGARPMHPDWVRSIRDQCTHAGAPFFFKQWGEYAPVDERGRSGGCPRVVPMGFGMSMAKMGKKAAGRELDGRTWDEYPASSSTPA
jgi:protein gp37